MSKTKRKPLVDLELAAADWEDGLQVGDIAETTRHFIAADLFKIGKVKSGKTFCVFEFEREEIAWLIEALQKELVLAGTREN